MDIFRFLKSFNMINVYLMLAITLLILIILLEFFH